MATHSSILAWEISWTEEPGRLQSTVAQSQTGLKRFSTHACFSRDPEWSEWANFPLKPGTLKVKQATISEMVKDVMSDNINLGQGYRQLKYPRIAGGCGTGQTAFIPIWQHLVKLSNRHLSNSACKNTHLPGSHKLHAKACTCTHTHGCVLQPCLSQTKTGS